MQIEEIDGDFEGMMTGLNLLKLSLPQEDVPVELEYRDSLGGLERERIQSARIEGGIIILSAEI